MIALSHYQTKKNIDHEEAHVVKDDSVVTEVVTFLMLITTLAADAAPVQEIASQISDMKTPESFAHI